MKIMYMLWATSLRQLLWIICIIFVLLSRLASTPLAVSTQKLIAKWFHGRELNTAFGLRVSVARVVSTCETWATLFTGGKLRSYGCFTQHRKK